MIIYHEHRGDPSVVLSAAAAALKHENPLTAANTALTVVSAVKKFERISKSKSHIDVSTDSPGPGTTTASISGMFMYL
jgi:hypothetical protein